MALGGATLAAKLLRPARATGLLGRPRPRGAGPPGAPPGAAGAEARLVGHAVARVAGRLPWRPTCLPRAIATRWMLRRRGISCRAHLGVITTDPFEAHAWVTVHGTVVEGGPVHHATEIAQFE